MNLSSLHVIPCLVVLLLGECWVSGNDSQSESLAKKAKLMIVRSALVSVQLILGHVMIEI